MRLIIKLELYISPSSRLSFKLKSELVDENIILFGSSCIMVSFPTACSKLISPSEIKFRRTSTCPSENSLSVFENVDIGKDILEVLDAIAAEDDDVEEFVFLANELCSEAVKSKSGIVVATLP